jgi:hypothetical protein
MLSKFVLDWTNLWWYVNKNRISHVLVMVIRSACLLISYLNPSIVTPIPCSVTNICKYDSVCFFLLSTFYWIDLCLRVCVGLANLWWNVNKNRIGNQISLVSVMVIGSACLLIPYLNPSIVLPTPCSVMNICKSYSVCFFLLSTFYWSTSAKSDKSMVLPAPKPPPTCLQRGVLHNIDHCMHPFEFFFFVYHIRDAMCPHYPQSRDLD